MKHLFIQQILKKKYKKAAPQTPTKKYFFRTPWCPSRLPNTTDASEKKEITTKDNEFLRSYLFYNKEISSLLGSIPHRGCERCMPIELVAALESRLHWDHRNACYLATFAAGPAQSVIVKQGNTSH